MKLQLALTSTVLSFLLVWPSLAVKPPKCKLGTLRFACPKRFKSVPIEPQQSFALFHQKKYGVGLFIASPESGFDERTFMTNVTKTTLAKLFPGESQTYAWKPVDFSGSISKFEISGGMVQGFNGSHGVLIKYRHLKFNGREIIVGYAAEFGRDSEGKAAFDRGLGGDSMPGCYAAVNVIYSITGEKKADSNPCDLVVSVG